MVSLQMHKEFKLSAFYLNARSTKVFYLSAWRSIHPYLLLGTRIFILVYSIIFMSLAIYAYEGSRVWLLHITSWNYILSTLYFALVISIGAKELIQEKRRTSYSVISVSPQGDDEQIDNLAISTPFQINRQAVPIILLDGKEMFFNCDHSDFGESDDEDDFIDIDDDELFSVGFQLPIYYRLTYCIFNISSNLSVVIAIAYWTILNDYDVPIFLNLTSYAKIDATVVLVFWMMIELVLNDIPIRLMHFLYPAVMTAVYFIVYTIYTMVSNHVIYETIDWRKSPIRASVTIFLFVLGIILTHLLMFFLSKVKKQLSDKMNEMRKQSSIYADR